MQQSNKINAYLNAVCQQLRWKKAHKPILEEVEAHITDQKNAYINGGIDEETAIDRAIKDMGDPIIVGGQLDRVHRPKPAWSILVPAITALIFGLAVQLLIGTENHKGASIFNKQLIWSGISIIVMLVAYFADFTIIGKYPKTLFFALAAATIAIILLSNTVNGKHTYASYLLLLFPTAFTGIVYRMRNKGYPGIVLCGMFFMIPAVIALFVPSITSIVLISVSCLVILTVAVAKGWFHVRKLNALLLMYIPTAIVLLISLNSVYSWRRLQVILNPSIDPQGSGYMGNITRQLIAGAKFYGQGTIPDSFHSKTAFQVLPGINTDFLLTYLIHRVGWIAFVVIAAILLSLIIQTILLSKKQKSMLGIFVSTAIIATFAIQSIVYIVANLGYVFFSPLSLPLISFGGTYLIINMCLIGILLSVFRISDLVKDKVLSKSIKPDPFIRFEEGKIIIDLNRR